MACVQPMCTLNVPRCGLYIYTTKYITWSREFCNKSLDKRQGSSDWNKDINDLSDKQLEYAANDVVYLLKIKTELEKMLVREKRMDVFNKCLNFLDTRVQLDQSGFKFDIFEH